MPYFRPDERGGVFTGLYDKKLRDVLALLEGKRLRILDVGGGYGRMAGPLARFNRVLLTDIAWEMIDRARRSANPSLECVQADGHSLPFGDATFDCVLAIDLTVHLENPSRAFAEFARVLRPGGRLVVDATNSNPLWTLFYPEYVGLNPLRWANTMLHGGVLPEWQSIVRHYRRSELTRIIATAGFVLLRQFSYGPAVCPKWFLALAAKVDGASFAMGNREEGP